MDKSKKNDAIDDADFVLKHRVVGAGVLLLFGAVVLPLLLGPPSQASKIANNTELDVDSLADFSHRENSNNNASSFDNSSNIEDELLAAIEAEDIEMQEQVYISKITPLDNRPASTPKRSDTSKPVAAKKQSKKSPEKLAKPEADKFKADKTSPDLAANKPIKTEAIEKPSLIKSDKKLAAAEPTAESKVAEPASTPAKIELGWVVQVGVFTDKQGANKVVKDLQSKGFTPSITVVDTNRGKGTGTRVWLGPFAQRVDAAKTKTRLTEKTGEPGFIRAFP